MFWKSDEFPASESVGCTETIFGQIRIWFCVKKQLIVFSAWPAEKHEMVNNIDYAET